MTPDYQDDDDVFEPPVNPIPPAVLGIVGLIAVIEIVFQLANAGMIGGVQGIGWRVVAGQDYGLSPALFDTMVMLGDYGFENLRRFVTYAFVHYDLLHMVFAGVLLLALGKFVGELLSGWAVVAIFLAATVLGGLAYVVLAQGRVGLLGAYPAVYGFVGAYTYLTWLSLKSMGQNQLQAFRLIAMLLGLTLAYGLIFGADLTWIAEITGFVVGFGLTTLLAPGGWAAFLARVRQRG